MVRQTGIEPRLPNNNRCSNIKRKIIREDAGTMNVIRKHISFYGVVQCVGFRYRARYAAEYVGATGWVKNEYDGSVTMEIQGTQDQIDQVIRIIEKGAFIRIEKMVQKNVSVEANEYSFNTG